MVINLRRVRGGGLREYTTGYYPVPGWTYSPAAPMAAAGACCCGPKRRARRRGMGDLFSDFNDPALVGASAMFPTYASSTGSVPVTDYNPSLWVGSGPAPAPSFKDFSVTPGGGMLSTAQLAQLANDPSALKLPSVSPETLLAAAALPNAPAVVKQAAAQYQAANPVSGFLSGTIFGLPAYLVLGGGALALFAAVGSGRRR